MLRLAIFLCVVVLLFRAGMRPDATPAAALRPAPPAATTVESRIGAWSGMSRDGALPALPGRVFPETPAPFDLASTTRAEPARLAAAAPDSTGQRYAVPIARLALRAGPSFRYPELATVARGEVLIARGARSGDWLWVETGPGGPSGYVAAGLLRPAD